MPRQGWWCASHCASQITQQHSPSSPNLHLIRLRREHGISSGIPVLLSTEKPRVGLVYGGEEEANPLDYQIVPGFRVRTIPVLGTLPAIFGMAAASWILCQLAQKPFVPEPVFHIEVRHALCQICCAPGAGCLYLMGISRDGVQYRLRWRLRLALLAAV